ncbi:MAG: RNase adapter RapZ [Burkholderiales bacterium]|nr:MAG: RNase adapter RapZ [Burkholderiales bacterium]
MRVVLVTGISGSGKSIALNVLEDDGFYCIDNLPVQFLPEVIGALQQAGHAHVAVSIDARSGTSLAELRQIVGGLSHHGHDVKVLFLNARTDTLVQRYSETRRRHPLATRIAARAQREARDAQREARDAQPAPGDRAPTLIEAIEHEREVMSVLEDMGVTIDTSDMHPNMLRQWVREVVDAPRATLTLSFVSFAYKQGIPLDADLVFDVRCLPNPYYVSELRPLSGLDAAVAAFLCEIPSVQRMIEHIANFLRTWLPSYVQEHRSYLTVALGCTGGQHRSVYCVEQLAGRFSRTEHVLVRHRALGFKQHAAR